MFRRFAAAARLTRAPRAILGASDPERLINLGRLVTALFAVLAIYLDPTQPSNLLGESEMVLNAYVLFSVVMVLIPVRRSFDDKVHIIIHGVDVLVLGSLSLMTNELTSPFFAFLPFILLATTMRWGMVGAFLGAMVLEAVLIVVAWPDLEDGESELNVLIMRSAYFLVAAAMLGYFGASRDASRRRLARLADWPSDAVEGTRDRWLNSLLNHAAAVLGDPRLVVVWEDEERGTSMLAHWESGRLDVSRIDPSDAWLTETGAHGLLRSRRDMANGQDSPLLQQSGALRHLSRQRTRCIYSKPFSGIRYQGRLFVLDPDCSSEEGDSLTEIIAVRIGSELERLALMEQMAESARAEERVRLARDLHDSILQDMTAAGLQLKAATASMPESLRPSLRAISALIVDQQRRIRLFVENFRPSSSSSDVALSALLADQANWLRERWRCEVVARVETQGIRIPEPLSSEISHLVAEATANAVRHGGASRVELTARRLHDRLEMEIEDNGRGLDPPHRGSFRPTSLTNRVQDLGGNLSVLRHNPGVSLRIELPI
ncbi:histidine kinase [Sphingosinicella sp. BN140058]|uniref:sensor histidine kinase n=1 Tax=Sphingosinicella sp. BN140058 TaxID=1892855 RepID=UPI0013ECAB7F|nr:histidine kinase [Sphingosinicella sp. BN140058]